MADAISTNYLAKSRMLWIPLLLIAIGAVLALIGLSYVILSYAVLLKYSTIPTLLIVSLYGLATPLIVVGVALLLIFLTESNKGMATWSKMIFVFGAFLLFVGGLFSVAFQVEWYYNQDWTSNPDLMEYLNLSATALNFLGTFLCALAILLLARAYLKGEIRAKPREKYGQ
jgi:hypothetical protein